MADAPRATANVYRVNRDVWRIAIHCGACHHTDLEPVVHAFVEHPLDPDSSLARYARGLANRHTCDTRASRPPSAAYTAASGTLPPGGSPVPEHVREGDHGRQDVA